MSKDPFADRLAKQMRYAQPMDPCERADAERAAYYAAFDRTVATLPQEKAQQVDLLASGIDKDDTWVLRNGAGFVIAKVRDPEAAPLAPAETKPDGADRRSAKPATKSGLTAREKSIVQYIFKKIKELSGKTSERVQSLDGRIKALETTNTIDAEVMKTLEEMSGRLEAIEQRGFRFVGKYQAPASYSRGDVVNYKGALWNCVVDAKVGDRPNTASHKWALMIAGVQE
ncbi:hypothetical protein [Pseudoxanthomonas indica]|uniref:Carbohydrate binding domain-containing protein n=1 Tax=Pseudoxanthomonas indica TaxID=428993 RepID=A0A1T5LVW9_9GAMM|nr:hypothetical protein [Pseudoxanthomonas indica]GGD40697.1 hypothetical protein GCM10007235_10930 [Pseudoxanthomonas indica]SKC80146.1 hypothetical protein SAMN06296058_3223 [Pseudoxanthomonas indica]